MKLEKVYNQVELYKKALSDAKTIETEMTWVGFYERRLEELGRMELCLSGGNLNELEVIMELQSRAYGWSFTPGNHGEKAEVAFWRLKELISVKS